MPRLLRHKPLTKGYRDIAQDTGKWHTILVASDEEEEHETALLEASSQWKDGDNLMVIRLVAVEPPEVRKQSTSIEASAAGFLS